MNGDQFFTATFTPNGLNDFPPFPPTRPKASRSPLGGAIAASSTSSSNGVGGSQHSPQSTAATLDTLPDHMAGLSVTPQKQMLHNAPVFQGVGRNPGAMEFVPKSSAAVSSCSTPVLNHSASTPTFQTYAQHAAAGLHSGVSPMGSPGLSPSNSPMVNRRPHHTTSSPIPALSALPASTETVGGTTYFYSSEEMGNTSQASISANPPSGVLMPNFTMYPGILPHVAHMKPKASQNNYFVSDELKMDILNRHAMTMAQVDHDVVPDIPVALDNYHNLFPLEPHNPGSMHKSATFGYPTSVYRATNVKDGLTYCLRRVHGFRLVNTKCMGLIDQWKKIQHANVVQLREVFTTKAFNDHSIVFVYDFFPGAETVMAAHFNHPHHQHNMNGYSNPYNLDGAPRPYSAGKSKGRSGGSQQSLPENQLWSYIVQLSSALRTIHAQGLACRVVDPSKLLITDKTRLRLNCIGIIDVLIDPTQNNMDVQTITTAYQQEDLLALGKVVLALACGSTRAFQPEHLATSLELVQRNYSQDLKNLFVYLFSSPPRPRSVNDIMPMIGARFYSQLEAAQTRADMLDNELAKEVENSRLFRLVCKLGVLNDRPEFGMDAHWSETGERYMLKLFRDYLFHQVDENGQPWLDMAHIITALNKLDAGVPEKVMLMSRDEQNILVVTYSELKRCLETAFSDITSAASGSTTLH